MSMDQDFTDAMRRLFGDDEPLDGVGGIAAGPVEADAEQMRARLNRWQREGMSEAERRASWQEAKVIADRIWPRAQRNEDGGGRSASGIPCPVCGKFYKNYRSFVNHIGDHYWWRPGRRPR